VRVIICALRMVPEDVVAAALAEAVRLRGLFPETVRSCQPRLG
jgi:hypothetical protein